MKTPIKKLVLAKETVKMIAVKSGVRTGAAIVLTSTESTGGVSVGLTVPPRYSGDCSAIIVSGSEQLSGG